MTDELRKNWKDNYMDTESLLIVKRLRKSGLNTSQINSVLDALDDLCRWCWNSPGGCQCENDE